MKVAVGPHRYAVYFWLASRRRRWFGLKFGRWNSWKNWQDEIAERGILGNEKANRIRVGRLKTDSRVNELSESSEIKNNYAQTKSSGTGTERGGT